MRSLLRMLVLPGLTLGLLSGCSGLRDSLDPQPPTIEVEGVRMTALSFNHADLELRLRVENPNAMAIRIAGYDYRLRVDGHPVMEGERDRRIELKASDATVLEVPLRLNFGDVAGVLGSLSGRDRIAYEVRLGVEVDVPVLGKRRVVAETGDSVPIPQRPELSLQALRVTSLGINGATLEADLGITNPNAFALTLDRLEWNLSLDGSDLVSGGSTTPLKVAPNGRGVLTLRLTIGHEDVGRNLYSLLGRSGPVDYQLRAMLAATAADERLGRFELPLSRAGRVRLH